MLNNTGGAYTPLFEFNMLYDINYALIIYLTDYEDFPHNLLDYGWYDKHPSMIDISIEMIDRKDINPLRLLAKPDVNIELVDKYYDEIMKKDKEEIIKYCVRTSLSSLPIIFKSNADIVSTILCKDKYEEEYLKRNGVKANILNLFNIESHCKEFNQIYLSYVSGTTTSIMSKLLKNKTVYFANMGYNLTEIEDDNGLIPTEEMVSMTLNHNNIMRIDIYNKDIIENALKGSQNND